MNRLYLVRHGENPANITKEFSHRKVDYPLTPKGILQAQQTAAHFRGQRLDAIVSSPLRRALQTAEIIAAAVGLPVTVLEQFREINVGALEDMPPTRENWAIHDTVLASWRDGRLEAAFPGGEDYHTLRARVHDGLVEALHAREGQRIAIVAHGGICTAFMASFCATDAQLILGRPNHNCSITTVNVERTPDGFSGTLVEWAGCAHLSGEAANFVAASPTGVLADPADRR